MRETKFRGKRIDNGEWVYGFHSGRGKISIDKQMSKKKFISIDYEVDPETVGEFTGEPDGNKIDVYESDVLRFDVLPYDGEKALLNQTGIVKCKNLGNLSFGVWDSRFCVHEEVIGNVTDNPELLESNGT